MRLNEKVQLQGRKVLLVPYCRIHVLQYHSWMQDPWILEMTCSEPLTLEEEYENQRSWHLDEKKMTFIILDPSSDPARMVGDVNLYYLEPDEEGDDVLAEIEVMIAEEDARRKGLATEAVRMMMAYAIREIRISKFVAKILESNQTSIHLFERLGFSDAKRVPAFAEVHLSFNVTAERRRQVLSDMDYVVRSAFARDDI